MFWALSTIKKLLYQGWKQTPVFLPLFCPQVIKPQNSLSLQQLSVKTFHTKITTTQFIFYRIHQFLSRCQKGLSGLTFWSNENMDFSSNIYNFSTQMQITSSHLVKSVNQQMMPMDVTCASCPNINGCTTESSAYTWQKIPTEQVTVRQSITSQYSQPQKQCQHGTRHTKYCTTRRVQWSPAPLSQGSQG